MNNRIIDQAPRTTSDLVGQMPDVVIERENMSQVTVESFRINILVKSGQWYSFMVLVAPRLYSDPMRWQGQPGQLVGILGKFCKLNPPIVAYVKQKHQWNPLP